MFKLGLDRHGVISEDPQLFAALSKKVRENGGEIHILTGNHIDMYNEKKSGQNEPLFFLLISD